ncbi:MAG: MgtC/SapB family protein [Vibrio sp.]
MNLQDWLNIHPFEWGALLTCAMNGILIGLERQLRGKPVGIRTAILIISGTYLFMAMAVSLSPNTLDQARVLGQIITGVGFLGAGVMMTLDGKIHGVTSAAVIWLLAGLGLMIGLGYHSQSIIFTVLTLGVLLGVDKVEKSFQSLRRGVHQTMKRRRRLTKTIKLNKEDRSQED